MSGRPKITQGRGRQATGAGGLLDRVGRSRKRKGERTRLAKRQEIAKRGRKGVKTPGREKTIGRPTLSGFPDWGGGLLDAIPPKGGYSSHLRHWRNVLRPSPLSSKGSSFLTEEGATDGRVIANESVPHDCDRAEWLLSAQKIYDGRKDFTRRLQTDCPPTQPPQKLPDTVRSVVPAPWLSGSVNERL